MTERQKMMAGKYYFAGDPSLQDERQGVRRAVYAFNQSSLEERGAALAALKQYFRSSTEALFLEPPFHCDYGGFISFGDNVYANINLTILDAALVTIGDFVFIGPNVTIVSTGHPLDAGLRNSYRQFGSPVTIGNNVWIGASVTICPGVTIGDNAVIGAGSIVNRDIPPNVIAVGNPCKVLRELTEEDRQRDIAEHSLGEQDNAAFCSLEELDTPRVKMLGEYGKTLF